MTWAAAVSNCAKMQFSQQRRTESTSAWQLEWKEAPPPGQQALEFQNTAIRAYKRLAGIME
jgi:hypothetical protein